MNEYIYIFSRRQKAIKCIVLLESIKEHIDEEQYHQCKQLIKNVFLENRSKQILPWLSWVIKSWKLKTELYLNMNNMLRHNVLEHREYIGIDPTVWFDLDAPSIVTAMTPPHYEQPVHNHEHNREITFYTGPSKGKYYDQWQEYSIDANFGDFIIFPPKTYHTIANINDFAVRNISIKLPGALLDRGTILENNETGSGTKQSLDCIGEGVWYKEFPQQNMPYVIHLYDFKTINQHTIQPQWKCALYILGWEFMCQIDWGQNNAISESDVIIWNCDSKIQIQSLNPWVWNIYMVTLTH
jgi:hypothetical protein